VTILDGKAKPVSHFDQIDIELQLLDDFARWIADELLEHLKVLHNTVLQVIIGQ
jgi:hypothetical protein